MKMTFLLFCAALFDVWGVPQSFLRSIMNVNHIYGFTQVKKNFQTSAEIPFEKSSHQCVIKSWESCRCTGTTKLN